jgi:shikimate kinase
MNSMILIGMPGAGKTTLGKRLAASLQLPFYDTDQLLEQQTGCSLQANLDALGYQGMRDLEGAVISQFSWSDQPMIIATGGSAVYSPTAMTRLRRLGLCVYLQIGLATIEQRVNNWRNRGFVAAPGQTLESVLNERHALYGQFSDRVIHADGLSEDECLAQLMALYQIHSVHL